MSEYYTKLAGQAEAMCGLDITIAQEPALYASQAVAPLQESMRADFDLLMNMAADQGKDPANLRSLGISLVGAEESGFSNGALLDEPAILGNKVHYPVIQLTVPPELPAQPEQFIEKVNHSIRHEFRHVLQEDKGIALYQSRILRAAVTAGGGALNLLGLKLGYDAIVNDGSLILGATGIPAFVIGSALMVDPRAPLWSMSRPEHDAERYARAHPSLKPLSILE